ncbi:MAG TPA: sigma-70 family RNA polymerase sigma factor [Candidatus Gemmiger excrementigallinarum]|uniref:Sigma-70 family RNA polymerase sigma factor n=1 Tax=Candidatus Gemmiger excrementigallinarum TaxID=2838609 RepID=A0A9D2EQQ5_9FIRM|nr:sigma-70 family RNA polymerase sigma factor [Candidatus Gemmiger excrementigallinarum]
MESAKNTGQQETNAALAALAATGNAFALGQLWEINKGLLHSMFWKWYSGHREQADAHGMTVDDFEQEGFFAVQYAAEHYDPGKGIAFSTWLAYAMKRQIDQALTNGHRRNITGTDGKIHTISADPLNHCTSLDAPAGTDGESDTTFGELLPDQTAAREMQGVEDRLYHEQMHDAVENALEKLPPDELEVLRCHFYQDKTYKETASVVGKDLSTVRAIEGRALRNLRADPKLRRWHDDFITTRAWSNAGFFAWQNSGSIEERTIESLENRNLLNVCP